MRLELRGTPNLYRLVPMVPRESSTPLHARRSDPYDLRNPLSHRSSAIAYTLSAPRRANSENAPFMSALPIPLPLVRAETTIMVSSPSNAPAARSSRALSASIRALRSDSLPLPAMRMSRRATAMPGLGIWSPQSAVSLPDTIPSSAPSSSQTRANDDSESTPSTYAARVRAQSRHPSNHTELISSAAAGMSPRSMSRIIRATSSIRRMLPGAYGGT